MFNEKWHCKIKIVSFWQVFIKFKSCEYVAKIFKEKIPINQKNKDIGKSCSYRSSPEKAEVIFSQHILSVNCPPLLL